MKRREILLTLWPERTPDPDAPRKRSSPPRDVPMPEQIGRFRILRPLGSGGMSVVYEAYDDRLERHVALKLLRERGGRRRQARLQREAQALARLSHPNVVEVYETGTHQGRAYLVMERLPGEPLQRWLLAAPRSVPEIVATFVLAGRGLSAAHAQGLVHRDFKPSNVLVDDDGRVRVVDFGLAAPTGVPSEDSVRTGPHPLASGPHAVGTGPHRMASGPHPALSELDPEAHYEDLWESALTRTGAMLGTPAYMSPEQYEGRTATAASDQFSFCVALYEALYGEHPFVERQQWDLLPKHVMEGNLREAPRGRGVSSALHRVIVRGLSVRPDARFPSIDALLGALQRALVQRRRLAWLGASVGVTSAVVALTLWLGHEPEGARLCTGAEGKLAEAWGPDHKAEVREALLATGVPYAEDTWRKLEGQLDGYGQEWSDAYRHACEAATHDPARGPTAEAGPRTGEGEGDAVMDGRMACLERRRRELGALVEVLAAADPGVVQQAIGAVSQLGAIAACDERATAAMAAPSDPALAERIEAHRVALSRAKALERAGRYRAGLELAQPVADAADVLGYAPLQAEAQLQVGLLQRFLGAHEPAQRALERAYFLAVQLEHDALAREAVTRLVYVVASLRSRPDEAEGWLEHARVAAERVGGDEARADYLGAQGTVLLAARRPEEALARFEEALPVLERVWGPRHPEVAAQLNNIGLVLLQLDRPGPALASIERSLTIREEALGSEHPEVAKMLNNLGLVLLRAGREDEAITSFTRAHALRLEVLGPDHPDVAKPLANLARVRLRRGELPEAAAHAEQALAIRERAHGVDSAEAAQLRVIVGRIHLAQGELWAAEAGLQRAVQGVEQALGAERVELVAPLLALAEAERRLGRLPQARAHVERALALGQTQALDPWDLAAARFTLARIDWDRDERGLARSEAEAAQRIYAGLPEARRGRVQAEIAELDAWLVEHGER